MHLLRRLRRRPARGNLPQLRRQFRASADPARSFARQVSGLDRAQGAVSRPPRVLAIAGSDSGGGAGVQADIKTVTMLGGHAMTAITAVTAQNSLGVDGVLPVPAEMVLRQIDSVIGDIGVDSIKVGMIGSAETAAAVAERLSGIGDVPIVFDPVMVATSGALLADDSTIHAFERLMAAATLVTPNAPELATLTGRVIGDAAQLESAAKALAARVGTMVLAKGGHVPGPRIIDLLVAPEGGVRRWDSEPINTLHSHGTGCTLSSAVATFLAEGMELAPAIEMARTFVRLALREAPGLGAGHGPMGQQRLVLDLPPPTGAMLNHVTLPAADYEASTAFYRLLGCTQIVAAPPRYARFEAPGGMTLSIEVRDPVDAPSTTEYFFQCADVDAEVERLIGQGMKFDAMPVDRDYLWRVAEARDPHGNLIRFYETDEIRRYPPWRIP
jgi:hydroxymethylpyrimidine/phosphomethylpyrimidine kinase